MIIDDDTLHWIPVRRVDCTRCFGIAVIVYGVENFNRNWFLDLVIYELATVYHYSETIGLSVCPESTLNWLTAYTALRHFTHLLVHRCDNYDFQVGNDGDDDDEDNGFSDDNADADTNYLAKIYKLTWYYHITPFCRPVIDRWRVRFSMAF